MLTYLRALFQLPHYIYNNMEKIQFDYSTTNILIAGKKHYLLILIEQTQRLIRNMRWRAFRYLFPQDKEEKETYGFHTKRPEPYIEEMETFKLKMAEMISNVGFNNRSNDFQRKLKNNIRETTSNSDLLIAADKPSTTIA